MYCRSRNHFIIEADNDCCTVNCIAILISHRSFNIACYGFACSVSELIAAFICKINSDLITAVVSVCCDLGVADPVTGQSQCSVSKIELELGCTAYLLDSFLSVFNTRHLNSDPVVSFDGNLSFTDTHGVDSVFENALGLIHDLSEICSGLLGICFKKDVNSAVDIKTILEFFAECAYFIAYSEE